MSQVTYTLFPTRRSSDLFQQVNGIIEMECRRVVRRVGSDAWRGFCQGTEVTLTFDEHAYAGCGAFLLASRSEEHTSELQSHSDLVCRLLLEKKKINIR